MWRTFCGNVVVTWKNCGQNFQHILVPYFCTCTLWWHSLQPALGFCYGQSTWKCWSQDWISFVPTWWVTLLRRDFIWCWRYFVHNSLTPETGSHSAGQDFCSLLWKPKAYYWVPTIVLTCGSCVECSLELVSSAGHVICMGLLRNPYVLNTNHEGEKLLGSFVCTFESNIKTDVKRMWHELVDLMQLADDRIHF